VTPLAINPYQYAYNNTISLHDATGGAPDKATPANQNGGPKFDLFVDTSLDDFARTQGPTDYSVDDPFPPDIFSIPISVINIPDRFYWCGHCYEIRHHRHAKTGKACGQSKSNYRYGAVRPPDSNNLGLGYDLMDGPWYCVGFYYCFENSSVAEPLHHDTSHISGSARETVRKKGVPSPKSPTPADDSSSAVDETNGVIPLS